MLQLSADNIEGISYTQNIENNATFDYQKLFQLHTNLLLHIHVQILPF